MALRDWLPWRQATDLTADPTQGRGVAAQEHGTAGTENFGGYIKKEDFNPDFDDWQKSVPLYDKMRRTDAQIRAMLQVIKLPLRGATWTCHPASSDPVDKQIADFCNNCLFDDDAMEDSFDFTLRHILLQLDFGVSVLEKVWKVDPHGRYRFRRLAPRLPKTLREWHVNREGKLVAIVQYAPVPHGKGGRTAAGHSRVPTYGSTMSYQYLTIPAEYCAVFSLDREGDNYQGTSLLRNVYRNYYFKDEAYRVIAVGLDRWGVGIPVAQLEEGHTLTTGDRTTLRDVLKSVRANEKAFMVMPEHVQFSIEPSGGGAGTLGGFGIQWIEHQDTQIARNVLAGFLTMGNSPLGSLGFGARLTDMFISSLNGVARGIAGDMKKQLVMPLCDFNFDMTGREYPEPTCLDLEQVDLKALVDTLATLQGSLITPQDDDETILRKMLGLPKLDPHRSRNAASEKAASAPTPPVVPGVPGVVPVPTVMPGQANATVAAVNPGAAAPIGPPAAT